MEINELTIPAPWGHISAKVWGNVGNPPILCFHGVMDNAGSFNRLIPLLPPNYRYVCVDLPGHGKSSPFPPCLPIHTIDYILSYTLTMNYLGREKYTIIAHSYGGQIGLLYSRLYPERVEKLVMLDTVHLFPVPAKHFANYLSHKFDQHFEFLKKLETREPPVYTYETALTAKINGRPYGKLSEECAAHLLERNLEPVGDDKFRFSHDQRLKNFINPLQGFQYALETLKSDRVPCPVIIILGKESQDQQIYLRPILKYFRSKKNFIVKLVEGDHDVHLTSPELVAPHIIKFLQKNKL